jgi:hypothetical protein
MLFRTLFKLSLNLTEAAVIGSPFSLLTGCAHGPTELEWVGHVTVKYIHFIPSIPHELRVQSLKVTHQNLLEHSIT